MAPQQISSTPDSLVLVSEMPTITPRQLFAYWITPDLLKRWWAPGSEIEARPGGSYRLSWPKMDRHLVGNYSAFEPGQKLAFSWQWEHMGLHHTQRGECDL